jgi:INO80 complex subunit C
MSLLTEADFAMVDRPFKSPSWKQTRKNKNFKALLADEQRRLANITPGEEATYFSIEAPPSLKPQKHWCDITGLPGTYKSARHGLRYNNLEVFQVIKQLAPGVDQQYLGLRNANVVLR